MTQTMRTLYFVASAVVVVLAAAGIHRMAEPDFEATGPQAMVGKVLFPNFDRALDATELEIIQFDPETATIIPFRVAQIEGSWCIPSHDNYPADAEDHLAAAATSVIGLKVLDVAADSPSRSDASQFGVVEPNPDQLEIGATGVGKRVIMRDSNGDTLLDLIIGKKVPDSEDLRYVRITGQDPVYVVKLTTDKLSNDFADWIEEDLLKLNPWDITDIQINDYSFDLLNQSLDPRARITLDYDDRGDPRWSLRERLTFDIDTRSWVPASLPEGKELDTSKLNNMRTALDDLEIVDVRRKPEGLSASLSAGEGVAANQEAFESLARAGFYPLPAKTYYSYFPPIGGAEPQANAIEIISSEGEVRVGMKNGVRYVLRFGTVTDARAGSQDEEGGEDSEEESGLHRYLMVMAEYDPALIPEPELEPLPELPANGTEENDAADGAATERDTSANGTSQDDTIAEAETAEAANEEGTSEAETAEETPSAEEIEAERERIERENQRKRDEYNQKVKDAKARVDELNARFADWYYIISETVYRDIHLGLDDITRDKEPETEGDATAGAGDDQTEAEEESEADTTEAAPESDSDDTATEPQQGESASEGPNSTDTERAGGEEPATDSSAGPADSPADEEAPSGNSEEFNPLR